MHLEVFQLGQHRRARQRHLRDFLDFRGRRVAARRRRPLLAKVAAGQPRPGQRREARRLVAAAQEGVVATLDEPAADEAAGEWRHPAGNDREPPPRFEPRQRMNVLRYGAGARKAVASETSRLTAKSPRRAEPCARRSSRADQPGSPRALGCSTPAGQGSAWM